MLVHLGWLLLLFVGLPARCEKISGWVGAHQLAFDVRSVPSAEVFPVAEVTAEFVAITEVYPDNPKAVSYHYLVTAPGLAPFERRYAARGFGPVTYFLRVARQPAGSVTLTNLGGGGTPQILGVRAVTRDELARVKRDDKFTLLGMAINPRNVMSEDEQVRQIAERLVADPKRNIARSFSCEIYYANRDTNGVRRQLEAARQWSLQYKLPVLLGMVSWWNGTPHNVPDGLGGKFGDLRYQQVCYTPDSIHPEDAKLRKLLGERYNPHYCLSTPNIWNNTPWLTMNSPELNTYRARRMREAVDLLNEVSPGDPSWIAGIFLENEPRYWDSQSTKGTPQWRGERWADFNPCVVAAAARDGVTLNPADGMSLEELTWLQKNAGHYFQETVNMFRAALTSRGLLDRFPIYTHSLHHSIEPLTLFPGVKMNHTSADWARAIGARTGIEGIWSQPSNYDRVREWGPWCNLNREETDGSPLETHLWDLRTDYAMGGELFNTYNWHLIKKDAYFNYARDFLSALPSVTLPPVRAKRTVPDSITFTPPGGLQAFTQIIVPVETVSGRGVKGMTVALAIDGGPNRTWFSERQPLPADGRRLLTFVFPAPAEVRWSDKATIHLRAYDAGGAEVHGAAAFTSGAAQELRLYYDLEQSRALSRLVIQWKQAAPR